MPCVLMSEGDLFSHSVTLNGEDDMKKSIVILCAMILILGVGRVAGAALTPIGTASYLGSNYNLIYEDDQHLVWLDYLKTPDDWNTQMSWAAGLNDPGVLSYNLYPGIKVTWGGDWRLPSTDESVVDFSGSSAGYQGPDETGHYSYWAGYNMTNSEMGHLYYESLMNKGYVAIDGTEPQPGWGLKNAWPFKTLPTGHYWSGTEWSPGTTAAWHFHLDWGSLGGGSKDFNLPVLAVRTADVVPFDPIKMDTMWPAGAVHAYPNVIWPPNNKMVTVTLEGYVKDELSIARDSGGTGVSSAYLLVDGNRTIPLSLNGQGRFSVTVKMKAKKGAVYNVELHATDTKPAADGGPNSGLVDSTYIRVDN
jgi:hypothetical protein